MRAHHQEQVRRRQALAIAAALTAAMLGACGSRSASSQPTAIAVETTATPEHPSESSTISSDPAVTTSATEPGGIPTTTSAPPATAAPAHGFPARSVPVLQCGPSEIVGALSVDTGGTAGSVAVGDFGLCSGIGAGANPHISADGRYVVSIQWQEGMGSTSVAASDLSTGATRIIDQSDIDQWVLQSAGGGLDAKLFHLTPAGFRATDAMLFFLSDDDPDPVYVDPSNRYETATFYAQSLPSIIATGFAPQRLDDALSCFQSQQWNPDATLCRLGDYMVSSDRPLSTTIDSGPTASILCTDGDVAFLSNQSWVIVTPFSPLDGAKAVTQTYGVEGCETVATTRSRALHLLGAADGVVLVQSPTLDGRTVELYSLANGKQTLLASGPDGLARII